MKKIYFFIFFIFLVGLVSSEEIIVSPGEINFDILQGQISCKNITISSYGEIALKDKWGEKWSATKELSEYFLSKEELNLHLDYSSDIFIENKTKLSICFSGEDIGRYHGVLLVKNKESKSGIGIWLNATIRGSSYTSRLTGAFLNSENKANFSLLFWLSFTSLLLILVFVFLLLKKK